MGLEHRMGHQQGLQRMFKQYNIIHIITSLALDNDVANVWILTVCGNNAHMFECFSQGVWNRLANKIRYMHLLKKRCTYSICGERVGGWTTGWILDFLTRITDFQLFSSEAIGIGWTWVKKKASVTFKASQLDSFTGNWARLGLGLGLVTAKGPLLVKGGVTHLAACRSAPRCLTKLLPKQIRNRESSLLSSALGAFRNGSTRIQTSLRISSRPTRLGHFRLKKTDTQPLIAL